MRGSAMSNNKLSLMVEFGSAGLEKLGSGLRNMVTDSKKGAAALRGLNREHKDISKAIAANAREMRNASGNITHLANKERELQSQLSATNRQIEQQTRLLAANKRADAVSQRGADLRGKGTRHIMGGVAAAAPFAMAVKSAAEFQSGMVDLQQKANLSDKATSRLANNIMASAAAAKQLPEDMRAGVDMLAGLGAEVSEAAQMIGPIGQLATAFKVDMADGAGAAFANFQNLKVGIGDTSKALDIMASAGNAGAFEVKDMAKHFPGLTAQANALGESGLSAVANLSAALQIARRSTGSSDEAANNLQNLYAKITAESTVKAFAKQFGVDLPKEMAKAKAAGMDTLEAIATITKKATGGDNSKIGLAFTDMQAQSAVRAMVMNLEDYKKIRDEALGDADAVEKAFNIRVANDPTVLWREMVGQVQSFAITTGTTLMPAMRDIASAVSTSMTAITAWTKANPEATATIVKFAAGLVGAKIGLGVLMVAFGGALGPLSMLMRGFGKLQAMGVFSKMLGKTVNGAIWAGPKLMKAANLIRSGIGFLASGVMKAGPLLLRGFGMMRTAVLFLGSGLMKAGAMMLANPIVLIIGAIVLAVGAAAYLIYTNWDRISAAFKTGVANVSAAIQSGKERVASFVDNFKSIGSAIIDGLANGIKAAPGKVWAALKGVVSGAWQNAKSFLNINSPSRLFMSMGHSVSQGLAVGIDGSAAGPATSARRLAESVAGGFGSGSRLAAQAANGGGKGATGGGTTITGPVTIQFTQQPGEDISALAKRLLGEFAKLGQQQARGSYADR